MMSKLLYRIRSAVLRLPWLMTQLMNLLTSGLSYSGSGATSRLGISRRLGIAESLSSLVFSPWTLAPLALRLLRPLCPVFRSSLHAALDAHRVERASHHVIANARQIFHTAAANEHQRVFLQVVADAGDVSGDFDAVREAHARDLAQRRIRLLGRLGEHADAHTALLGTVLQRRALRF